MNFFPNIYILDHYFHKHVCVFIWCPLQGNLDGVYRGLGTLASLHSAIARALDLASK